jgi:uncharacterized protein (DUF983 family)
VGSCASPNIYGMWDEQTYQCEHEMSKRKDAPDCPAFFVQKILNVNYFIVAFILNVLSSSRRIRFQAPVPFPLQIDIQCVP